MSNIITEDQYRRLKREVDEAKTEADRASGALKQLMKQLKEEFDCEDVKTAKALLAELEEKRDKVQKRFERSLEDYEKKWSKE
jgi:predicted  nucleic acid-binding Zn-ribbon protein